MAAITIPPSKYNFTNNPLFVEVETSLMSGSEPYELDEPNLQCYFGIWDGIDDAYLLTTKAPYSRYNKKMVCAINKIFDYLPPALPAATDISTDTAMIQPTHRSWTRFALLAADNYGEVPPTGIEYLGIKSLSFYILRGGSVSWNVPDPEERIFLLYPTKVNDYNHGYVDIERVVRPDTPILNYVFCDSFAPAITLNVKAIPAVGNTYDKDISLSTQEGVNIIKWGVNTFLDDGIDLDKIAYVEATINGVFAGRYIVDHSPNDYEYLILFETGLGGMEIVRFSGRHKEGGMTDKKISEKTIWLGANMKDGTSDTTNISSRGIFTVNSGYYPESYIKYLKSMINSDAWIVGRFNGAVKSLTKFNVENSRTMPLDDQNLKHNLELTLRRATPTSTESILS